MKNENVLDCQKENIHSLAAVLQDLWHYAALVKPPADGRVSTFAGDRYHGGLQGKLRAYDRVHELISNWSFLCFPAFFDLVLPDVERIESEAELQEQIGYAIDAINKVAVANNIDAYAGEVRKADPA